MQFFKSEGPWPLARILGLHRRSASMYVILSVGFAVAGLGGCAFSPVDSDGEGETSTDGGGQTGDETGSLCGNGITEPGEECDAGTDNSDSAGCTSSCRLNVCGDGLVWIGEEQCDDGNESNEDDCTTTCVSPSCEDMVLSLDESDVDCGGQCEACENGRACLSSDDCESLACIEGVCGHAESCRDLHKLDASLASGVYSIDIDGEGPRRPFDVVCDMQTRGGGWTSLVHVTEIDELNFTVPHTEVAISEGQLFWVLKPRDGTGYGYDGFLGNEHAAYFAQGTAPEATGWVWSGFVYPNPDGCHSFQDVRLFSDASEHPGNPSFSPGHSNPAGLAAAAIEMTELPLGAPEVTLASVHIGCVGANVLDTPGVWVR